MKGELKDVALVSPSPSIDVKNLMKGELKGEGGGINVLSKATSRIS